MANRRIERLAEQIRREMTEVVRQQVRDPRVGVVTITGVRVTPDLEQARVRVSVSGSPEEQASSIEGLHAAAPYIRTELSRRIRIRRMPELRFELDDSVAHVRRIDELIAEIQLTRPPEPDAPETPGGEGVAADGDDDVA